MTAHEFWTLSHEERMRIIERDLRRRAEERERAEREAHKRWLAER